MKKHCYRKKDCNCTKKATEFICRYCGDIIYSGQYEVTKLPKNKAICPSPDAPEIASSESFQAFLKGGYDCLDHSDDS